MQDACFIQIDFQQFFSVCPEDFLQVGPNQRICGSANSGTTQLIPINSNLISITYIRSNPDSLYEYDLTVKQIGCIPALTSTSKPFYYDTPQSSTPLPLPTFTTYNPNYTKPSKKPSYNPSYTKPTQKPSYNPSYIKPSKKPIINIPNLDTSGWRPIYSRPNYGAPSTKPTYLPPISPPTKPSYTTKPHQNWNWLSPLQSLLNAKIHAIQSFLGRWHRKPHYRKPHRKPTYGPTRKPTYRRPHLQQWL